MKIIPAIDLYNNKCVRLKQGKFENIKEYSIDPVESAKHFSKQGATEIHIVDLNGAELGAMTQLDIILNIKKATSLIIQCGGGFRTEETIKKALDSNIDRIVIGSLAAANPELINSLIIQYGVDRFVLALDITTNNDYYIAIKGWREKTTISLWDMLQKYSHLTNLRILCTDINRDGMLAGPNNHLYQECVKKYPYFHFQASGGIGQLQDLCELKKIGVSSAIVGKALYENHIQLDKAFKEITLC